MKYEYSIETLVINSVLHDTQHRFNYPTNDTLQTFKCKYSSHPANTSQEFLKSRYFLKWRKTVGNK